ncbi:MAG: molybdopterin-dependent oxidoreductase [Desulfobulbaceae bacterium]|nr:molybdopterin-dependent oxidoreductase [Desulfobulbaceae bacterium]
MAEQKLSRRSFLKNTGLSALALGLSQRTAYSFTETDDPQNGNTLSSTTVPTVCAMCRARCLVLATVREGRLLKLEGNPASPFNGRMVCARGQAAVKLLYDPDRLKYPLKRIGERGEGKWVRISWEEALATIASQFKKNLINHGPASLALFAGGPSSFYIKKLFQQNGISQVHDASFSHCDKIRNLAYEATFGTSAAHSFHLDYANTKCIVLLGSHVGENVQVPELRPLLSALRNGAELIVADPRYSAIAAKADHYLPVKPGTDIALLLGWLHHIVFENLYDAQWIDENASGFPELKNHLQYYTLSRVADYTGISVSDIRRTAETMVSHAPAVIIHPGNHLSWYGNDVQRVRAQALLAALLGAVDRTGSMQFSDISTPLPEQIDAFVQAMDADGPSFSALMNRMEKREIKFAGIWGQNPFQNHPSPYKTITSFKKAEFIFCSDILPGEASQYADIVLPEATFLERLDVLEVWKNQTRPVIASRFPVVKSQFEVKDAYWIVKRLDDQIGRQSMFPHINAASFLDSQLMSLGLSLAELRSHDGMFILEEEMADPGHDTIPDFSDIDPDEVFAEFAVLPPTRRIELSSSFFAEQGWDPLPGFNADDIESPPAGFVRLLYGRSPVQSLSFTTNNPWLNHEIDENVLWVNDIYAARSRVKDGEKIFLENQDGIRSIKPIKVKVTPGIRSDCVFMVHGYGCRSSLLKEAFNRGISDTALMTRSKEDPISGVRGMRVNFVRFVQG